MWGIVILSVMLLHAATGQPPQTPCGQMFDQGLQTCFQTLINMQRDIALSVLSNGATGPLPQGANKAALLKAICMKYTELRACVTNLVATVNPQCQQAEVVQQRGTVNSIVTSMTSLCGQKPQTNCLKTFETNLNTCVQQIQVAPELFRTFLGDMSKLPPTVNKAQFQQRVCSEMARAQLTACAQNVRNAAAANCPTDEMGLLDADLRGIIDRYGAVCSPCWMTYQTGLNQCLQRLFNMDRATISMVFNTSQPLPNTMNRDQLKQQICAKGNSEAFRNCGKELVTAANCPDRLTMLEFDLARLLMAQGSFCGDQSIPGMCLLSLQKKFGECYGTVGLDPKIYLGNDTQGALIGRTTEQADVYCQKKHDLYTCMADVMNRCPGAEQTMAMTGFDLHSMERAVGKLCHNIPDYLAGLTCFANPTPAAILCMENMTKSITDLSQKQLQQNLDMEGFFSGFCSSRVRHVACDGAAWPGCAVDAVSLKNEFECQLIPSRCYKSHKNNIDGVCPNTDTSVPTGETNLHKHEQSLCARNIHQTVGQCFQQYGLNADDFLVNVTKDTSNILGDANKASSFCNARNTVFQCMRAAFTSCPEATDAVAFWGYQQASLEKAVNVLCSKLPVYNKGLQCLGSPNTRVQQCQTNAQNQMRQLAQKDTNDNLTPDAYFRLFCSIRINQMKCVLSGWSGTCDNDVIGLKTEMECALLQDHCTNIYVKDVQTICTEEAFSQAGQTGGGGGGAGAISGSLATILGGAAAAILALFL